MSSEAAVQVAQVKHSAAGSTCLYAAHVHVAQLLVDMWHNKDGTPEVAQQTWLIMYTT